MQLVSCLNPQWITNPYTKERLVVPCGKCDKCRHTQQGKWVNRLQVEKEHWKYCVFFTLTFAPEFLPKIDLSQPFEGSEKVLEVLSQDVQSQRIAAFYGNALPYFPVIELQKFIKRLRKFLYEHEFENSNLLRYYVSIEYGPTSFRPHCHGLLFFKSEKLADNIKERVSKAWSHYDSTTHSWKSFGRTDAQFVTGKSVQYVSQYTSFISCLPKVLQLKPFKPYALYSQCPPIGSQWFDEEKVQRIFRLGLTEYSITDERTGELISVPLSRSLKDKLYPKIKGYSQLTFDDRVTLYKLGFKWQGLTPRQIIAQMYDQKIWPFSELHESTPKWFIDYVEQTFGKLGKDVFIDPDDLNNPQTEWLNENAFANFVYKLKRIAYNCNYFNVSLYDYAKKIDDFYQAADYRNLVEQIHAEQRYCDSIPKKDLRFLPFLIDNMFCNNERTLPLSTYDLYRSQFGLSDFDLDKDIRDSEEFQTVKVRMERIYSSSSKTRAKNEYLDLHPELKTLHYFAKKSI